MPLPAVLIDLAGVLHVGDAPLPGAVDALARLRAGGARLLFLTNTTRRPQLRIAADLTAMGFAIDAEEIVTAASIARWLIESRGWHPHVLVHPGIAAEFADLATDDADCVLLGDAADGFSYAALDACFRILVADPQRPLVAMAANRCFREADGLHLDMGAFVAALEYATGRPAIVTGKPSPDSFNAALKLTGARPDQAVMIGDDVEADIEGARALGMKAILVRTGKFAETDADRAAAAGADLADDFAAAVERILTTSSR